MLEGMLPGLGMQWWERGRKVVGGLPLVWVAKAVLAAVVKVRHGRWVCLIHTPVFNKRWLHIVVMCVG
jgi:hypothetical protein